MVARGQIWSRVITWDDRGSSKTTCAQITGFVQMNGGEDQTSEGVIIRWMDRSSLSAHSDHRDRPIRNYPLGFNHCLWEWSKTANE